MTDADTTEAIAELRSLIRSDQGKAIPLSAWDQLDAGIAKVFPSWYRSLVANFAVCDVGLCCDNEHAPGGELGLTSPSMISGPLDEFVNWHYGHAALLKSNFFPIAYTDNGDIYVSEREFPTKVGVFNPTVDGTEQFVAEMAETPQWASLQSFLASLWPVDDDHLNQTQDEQDAGHQDLTRSETKTQ